MQYKTHLATSFAICLPIMATTDTLSLGTVSALALGALFPDIDEPHSWIGCRTRGISDILNTIFGHRGLTHSLFGLITVFLTIMLLITLTHFKAITGVYFMIGYALHLVEDSFSKTGIKWLLPLSDKNFQSGMGIFYYRTGRLVENLIFFSTLLILFIEIKTLDFGAINIPKINVIETFKDHLS